MRDIRIVFMGTPDFAVATLKTLVEANHTIVGVITAPDRPAGRGQKLRKSAVKEYAESQDLTILQPTNLKNEDFLSDLKALNANLQIIVAFRMLPKAVWDMPTHGTFNLHASLLPQYRGAAPINWAIINGETTTGVTTFFIDEKIDTGAIIMQKEVAILPQDTVGTLHDTLMHLGSGLVLETVESIAANTVKTTIQTKQGDLKTAYKLNPDNTKIDWSASLSQIHNHIRGLSPYPVAWATLINNNKEERVKVYSAFAKADSEEDLTSESTTADLGTLRITKKSVDVRVSDGYICITEIQLPGKRKMLVKDLLNGYSFSEKAKIC